MHLFKCKYCQLLTNHTLMDPLFSFQMMLQFQYKKRNDQGHIQGQLVNTVEVDKSCQILLESCLPRLFFASACNFTSTVSSELLSSNNVTPVNENDSYCYVYVDITISCTSFFVLRHKYNK